MEGVNMEAQTLNEIIKSRNFWHRKTLKEEIMKGLDCQYPAYLKILKGESIPSPFEREGIVNLVKKDVRFNDKSGKTVVHKYKSIFNDEYQMNVSDLLGK